MRPRVKSLLAAGLSCFACTSIAVCDDAREGVREFSVTEIHEISDPASGGATALLRFAGLDGLRAASVHHAYFLIPPIRCDRSLRINVAPLSREWSTESVAWITPWQRPGGDMDSTASQTVWLQPDDPDTTWVNLTPYVWAIATDASTDHGIGLRLVEPMRSDTADREALLSTLSTGLLRVSLAPRAPE